MNDISKNPDIYYFNVHSKLNKGAFDGDARRGVAGLRFHKCAVAPTRWSWFQGGQDGSLDQGLQPTRNRKSDAES